MSEDESRRSLFAYVLLAIGSMGLLVALLGVTLGFPLAALLGGLVTLLALVAYSSRPIRFG